MALRLRQIRKHYQMGSRTHQALQGIDLDVVSGEFVAITGPSGCGKSTLLNVIGCLDRPDGGALWLADERADQADANARARLRNRHIGFVFQQFQLLPQLTALDNVALPLLYVGTDKRQREAAARQALASVGLLAWAEHRPSQLSGGQQQRVALARALVRRPTLLLADEPTGALDSATARETLELMHQLHRAGATILLVTHDEHLARQLPRRVHMQDGCIMADT